MQLDICIIDDDLVSQFATRYCIEQYGEQFSISTCANAEEALERFKKLKNDDEKLPDLIFLDLVMGDMNGWEFLENLQSLLPGDKLPEVYVLSGFVNSKDRALAKSNTLISGYIDKPLSRNGLDKIFAVNTINKPSTI